MSVVLPLIRVGPVLSFRGVQEGAAGPRWKVSVLIGVARDADEPVLTLDGAARDESPVELCRHGDSRILRYDLSVRLGAAAREVPYHFGGDAGRWRFTVPGADLQLRHAYVSCNGTSSAALLKDWPAPAQAVWSDLMRSHSDVRPPEHDDAMEGGGIDDDAVSAAAPQPFHLLLMGGDQLYMDTIWDEIPELRQWVELPLEQQRAFEPTPALRRTIDEYYFAQYPRRWLDPQRGPWAQARAHADAADAMASLPTVMMWDDHDIFDGWGSYSAETQACPLYQLLFRSARRAFWVYQMQHRLVDLPEPPVAGVDAPEAAPVDWASAMQDDPLALPLLPGQPGLSFAHRLGRGLLLVPDLRSERSRVQVCSEGTWRAVQAWLGSVSGGRQRGAGPTHLMLMSSVPVVHPQLPLVDAAFGMFGTEAVVDSSADDLQDHWAHADHRAERHRLAQLLMNFARERKVRVVILSGDVHLAALGVIECATPAGSLHPAVQLTASAVVHPPDMRMLDHLYRELQNRTARVPQPVSAGLHARMLLFPAHDTCLLPARNWLALAAQPQDPRGPVLRASWRCERAEGFTSHHYGIALHAS